jgi:hypothetical protein
MILDGIEKNARVFGADCRYLNYQFLSDAKYLLAPVHTGWSCLLGGYSFKVMEPELPEIGC